MTSRVMGPEEGWGSRFEGSSVRKLKGESDYLAWSFSMKALLKGKGLWEFVDEVAKDDDDDDEGGAAKGQASSASGRKKGPQARQAADPEEVDPNLVLKTRKRMDDMALSLIILNVAEKLHYLLRTAKTARVAWQALEQHFRKANSSNLVLARSAFLNAKYKSGETMETYLTRVDQLWDRANIYLETADKSRFDDGDKTMVIVGGLPEIYSSFASSIIAQPELTSEAVGARLQAEEARRRQLKGGQRQEWVAPGGSGHKKLPQGGSQSRL